MSRTSATARRATSDDLDAIVSLSLEARDESVLVAQVCSPDVAVLRDQLGGGLDQPETVLLVACRDDAVVGFSVARVVHPGILFSVGWLEVHVIYARRSDRRRGVGHELMAGLVRVAQDEQCEYVVAMPLTAARSEQRFLARLGFVSAGARRIVPTVSLARRIELAVSPRERRRDRGRESLLAAGRRVRRVAPAQPKALPLAAGVESSSMQVSRPLETRRPASSVTTNS